MTIFQRMVAILDDLPAIGKDQKNTQQNFMFRGHDDVMNALNPLLAKHQVFVVPDVRERVTGQRQTSKGSVMFEVNLHVGYRFYGPEGDYVEASAWGEGTDMGDKATNKAMTMAFKNVLNQAFAISTQETVDSDAHTDEETVRRTKEPRASAAHVKALHDVVRKLSALDGSRDWGEMAEKAASKDFGHGVAALTKPELDTLVATMGAYAEKLEAVAKTEAAEKTVVSA